LEENFDRFNFAIYKEKEMADFRRWIPVLAVLALLLGSAFTASAQQGVCQANTAVTPALRAEGLTELVGDVVLTCSNLIAGGTRQINIQLFFNTSVTSRLLTNAFATNVTEALLLLDEPASGTLAPCEVAAGCTSGTANAFRGQIPAGVTNSLLFTGVPIDATGTNRTIRITNVRVNANGIGISGGNSIPVPISAFISISPAQSITLSNPLQTVGTVQKGLTFTVGKPAPFSLAQCFSQTNTEVATITFSEAFPTAFKLRLATLNGDGTPAPQDTPGQIVFSESGFFPGGSGAPGLADFGTRLKAVFKNIPAGATVTVPLTLTDSVTGAIATLVSSEAGAMSASDTGDLTATNGSATAVWEVTTLDPNSNFLIDNLTGSVTVSFTANPGQNSPALGTATVQGSFAPTSTVTTASRAAPIPRFADTSTATNAFLINPCVTNLLFPFVTAHSPFDTGLAISNTSADPWGTSTQTGTCDVYAFSSGTPGYKGKVFTSPTPVAAGTTWTFLASTELPGINGYVIATCRFQYAHGFAFISDLGARNLAMGYLALLIPDQGTTRNPSPFVCAGAPDGFGGAPCPTTGEQLGQ
jgi:hypothetical protein